MNELIARFDRISKSEASEIYRKFKDTSRVEYYDLYAVCMFTFISAQKKYKGNGGFYSFWKTSAHRRMIEEVKRYSVNLASNSTFSEVIIGEDNNIDLVIAGDDDISSEVSRSTLFDQLNYIASNPEYKVSEQDVDMLICYLNGISIKEIAEKMNARYSSVRLRIVKVINIFRSILIKK